MKTRLKDNIWIEGFDTEEELYDKECDFLHVPKGMDCQEWISSHVYSGKTSEIPEEVAEGCVEILAKTSIGVFYRNYLYEKPQPVSFTKCTAKESIKSACDKEYCIIYKQK